MNPTSLISMLQKNQKQFHPVVPFNAAKEKLMTLDFTANNTELTDGILNDTIQFIHWVDEKLADAGARYGIGGYAEHRTVYRISKVFDGDSTEEEPRRLHLGTDIWGKPNTAVMVPCDGIVHSFAFNNQVGDYGATIILSHMLDGISFHTLYGHLSLNSIKNLQGGERVEKGDLFAELGITLENGSWPAHLHFQIVDDMGEWAGDYPGVCKFSEKEKWLANCPDPELILQLNQYL